MLKAEDLRVGEYIDNHGKMYQVVDFVDDKIILKKTDTGDLMKNIHVSWLNNTIRKGHTKLAYTEIKDNRLARKLYPNAEVLENGKLRIRG